MMKKLSVTGIFCLLISHIALAKVIPAACFTDNMVLQQKTNAALWGTDKPGRTVTITTSWNNKKYMQVTDDAGNWKVKVATPAYGGPYSITFDDGEKLTLNNVLIGEVWVCSGQSNMEMQVTGFYGDVLNLNKELADAANYPQIRMLKIDNKTSFQPRTDVPVKWGWNSCNSQTVRDFSAVAYFFAKNLYDAKHIPIGIINSTWGGTVAEAWTSGDALKNMPDFAPFVKEAENGLTQEKLEQKYKDDLRAWLNAVDVKDPAYQNGELTWAQDGFDDSQWKEMTLPIYWEQAGMPDYDGTVWFRKTVKLPSSWAGKDLKLEIGGIDDFDDSFFNGKEIGHTELFILKRSYTIPASEVKAGDNTIAIRVFDTGGLGGINKGPMTLSVVGDTSAKIDLAGDWKYKPAIELKNLPQMPVNPISPNKPTIIYNAMIKPIQSYTIKGVIWYQGESNADRPVQYEQLFPLLINDWRQKWGEGNFPFYYVQIANYAATDQPPAADWPALRYAQLKTLSVPNTGMAVTIDIGDYHRIHPQNKQEVGRRLALIALAKNYGENIPYSGPVYQSQKIEGNKIVLSFSHINGGLVAKGDTLKGFTIAGADKVFHPAVAIISGDKVVVSSADVANPVAVRYAWANFPTCNLYNGTGLPASPFKTDDWQGIR
jgi:sialate O-acetylesterase